MKAKEYPVDVSTSDARIDGERVFFDVQVRSRADRSLVVVDEVRAIAWNPDTRSVEVWLSPREPARGGTCRGLTLPHTRVLPAGETVTIPISLPRNLWRLTPREGGDATVEHADLSTAERVDAHVTVADGPFYPHPAERADTKTPPVEWGQRATVCARMSQREKP